MNKICTSLEQSKKLLELGIDINTADFMWEYNSDKETYWNKPTIIPIDDYIFVNDIPCWSLAALLDTLPSATLDSSNNHRYRLQCMERFTEWHDNAIDACYKMIVKLHEQNLL